MTRTRTLLPALALLAACSTAYALYSVADKGTWPNTWPKELEPLRRQSRTYVGPEVEHEHYQIPFTNREQFEAAWPHLLKVKSNAAPIILLRGPHNWLGDPLKAGVIVHAPPAGTDKQAHPEAPLPGQANPRYTWMWTTYIELVIDGDVVDLNRIPLPHGAPIIDERFKEKGN